MERWVPLFQIFLHSPSPEGEASLWFQQQPPPGPPHPPLHATSAFLSLLESPTAVLSQHTPTSPPALRRCMWVQTLPPVVQSRILSFLAIECDRFCHRRLHSLAAQILEAGRDGARRKAETFWVFRAAHNLLDAISTTHSDLTRQGMANWEESGVEKDEEFDSVPGWLSSMAAAESPFLPWLPLSLDQVRELGRAGVVEADDEVTMEEEPQKATEEEAEAHTELPKSAVQPLSPRVRDKASSLRNEILAVASASDALHIANEIQGLCFGHGGERNSLEVLSLIEPWELEDETASLLLSHLSSSGSPGNPEWPSHLLCSVVLPKLLVLQNSASRALLSATINFCKLHQVAAVNALFFPLALRKEGINTPLCDALCKIIKECLHPTHVAACCQKLLCGDDLKGEITCLPCHENLLSDQLLWTEPLFSLFQNILVRGVQLTPDTIDHLVPLLDGMAGEFAKSLKFCNFLLCLVIKCPHALKCHGPSLVRITEITDTFVTKSILSKLGSQ